MRRIRIALGVLFMIVGAAAAAQPKTPLTIAIFAPNAPFDGADARYAYVQRLATQVGNVTGATVKGVAFARAGDFEAALRKGTIDFAIVDAVYLAARGGFKVIATATNGGRTAVPWALFVGGGIANVTALQGKRLTYANASARDVAFVENALLESELNVGKYFGNRQGAPDIASAVASVTLGRADAVVAPVDRGKGLKKIFDAGTVPMPGFVQAKGSVPDATVAAVTKAVLGFGAGGALDGWKPGSAETYKALAGRMGARSRKAAMSEPDLLKLESEQVLLLGKLDTTLPPLQHYYWMP